MDKSKAEIVEIIKGALAGGPDAIADALETEGGITFGNGEPDGDERMGDLGPMPGQDAGITAGDSMKDSRGKAIDFAMKAVEKKSEKKPGDKPEDKPAGGNPFAK